MYPESKESSLAEQLASEEAISALTTIALELWLPLAQSAVLAAAPPPPNPNGAAQDNAQWNYLVDGLILYGIGIIAADAYAKAQEFLTGAPLAVAKTILAVARQDMPGMPTRLELIDRVSAVLSTHLSISVTDTELMLSANPKARSFVTEHVANVGRRVMDAVGRTFKRVTRVNDTAPDPAAARREAVPVFDAQDPQWKAAADEVGRTNATATLNSALEKATRDSGRQMLIEWVAILDTHTREAHRIADGQRQPPGTPFVVDGEPLRFPGDPLGDFDNTVNCRCRLFAYFNDLQAAAPVSEKVSTMTDYRSFTSTLAVIGEPTDDGRMFDANIALSFRDFPLPLLWQQQSAGGHTDAYTVGVIESAGIVGREVIGKGYLLNTPQADEAAMQIQHGVTGPSVDLGDVEWELRNAATGQPVTEEEFWDNPDMELVQTVMSAKVLAATLVATPAFGQTSITLGENVARGQDALVAAAAMPAPYAIDAPVYDASFFENPGFTAPTLPFIADGRIMGHLAGWNVCHTGIQDACVMAPHSQTDYAWFHTSPPVKTAAGKVKVGRLTVGCGHAGPRTGAGATIAHYDNAGTCFALVHVGEDEHGIWFSGVPAPGASAEQITAGLAAPLSGDWRNVGGNLELVAALAVNTPGFPILASGATDASDAPNSLIASLGPCASEAEDDTQLQLARQIVTEWRAAEKREAAAEALLAEDRRAQALALIEGEN